MNWVISALLRRQCILNTIASLRLLLTSIILIPVTFSNASEIEMIELTEEQAKPLYELGVGFGAFYAPHYPGSDQHRTQYLGLPFILYRGKVLKADDDGVRGQFKKTKNYLVDLSFSAAFPANAEDNRTRMGMPDLDWIGEVGPRFLYHIKKTTNRRLDLSLPIRAVFSTDGRAVKGRGFVFHPTLTYRLDKFLWEKMDWIARVGSIFATERTMDYFYEVQPVFAKTDRPTYNAKEGYLETHIDLAWAFNFSKKWRLFVGLQNNFYKGATNVASPLMKDQHVTSYAMGMVWTFAESEERAGANF